MSSSNLVLAGMIYSGSCHGAHAHDCGPLRFNLPQPRSQRPPPFCTTTEITDLRKNKKKYISDWPIKSFSSYANFFANQKKREHIDSILTGHLCTHKISYDLKPLRKAFISISSEITLQ